MADCPEENEIVDFVQGQLDPSAAAAIESHLDGCAPCLELVSALARIDASGKVASFEATELASRVSSAHVAGSASVRTPMHGTGRAPLVERGVSLGRYVVLDAIGSGGMGVVYAAYDPELDRKIALKVLRDAGDQQRARLVREGRSMARLSHPNVITVHDVGTYEGRPYIAMEFVDGETLASWQSRGRQPWRDVLARYLAAGEGLAAAHAAGLVHRDFKPANVLLGRDGRVRVTDFGLARAAAEHVEPPASAPDPLASGETAVTVSLTRTGALVGTPAYMSPEQYELRVADARSDQFSFCVALFEGLYGHRPYEGRTMTELATQVVSGAIRLPADPRDVPRRLLETLRRGLGVDPMDRFASMPELLAELRRDRTAPWRRVAVVSGPLVLIGAGLASVWPRGDGPCRDAEARLGDAWDDERRERVRSTFEAIDAPFAADAWPTVRAALDTHARAWVAGWTDACEATHIRHEQSEQLLDLRMLCLAERRSQLLALTLALGEADEDVVARSVDAVHELTPVSGCADVEALTAPIPPPDDPEVRRRVGDLAAELARADVMRMATKQFAEATGIARSVAEQARTIGYTPLEARALHRLATLVAPHEAEAAWTETFEVAIAARDDRVAAVAATELFGRLSHDVRRDPEADTWLRMAEALVQRVGGDERIRIRLLDERALRAGRRGDFEEALRLAHDVVARVEALEGPEHPHLAVALGNLGQVLQRAGALDEAIVAQQRALAIDEATRGPEHPDVSLALNNLAAVHIGKGDHALAAPLLERAVKIREGAFGPDDTRLLSALQNLAEAMRGLGRFEEADVLLHRAMAIGDAHAWNDRERARLLLDLGITAFYRGEMQTALAHYEDALSIHEAHDGPRAFATATVRFNVGEALELLGRLDEALEQHRRALEDLQATAGETHPYVAYPMGGLGRVHLERGNLEAAVPLLEQALETHEHAAAPPRERAVVRLALAHARRHQGEHARARALARAAATEAEAAGPLGSDVLARAMQLLTALDQ